jgi:hypothetical protein
MLLAHRWFHDHQRQPPRPSMEAAAMDSVTSSRGRPDWRARVLLAAASMAASRGEKRRQSPGGVGVCG